MKWIKLFEDLSEFEEIPSSELDSTNAVAFKEDDLSSISKVIYPSKIKVDPKTHLLRLGWAAIKGDLSYGYAYQKSDEWFYVFFARDSGKLIAYKCDQITGLLSCLSGFKFDEGGYYQHDKPQNFSTIKGRW